LSSCVSDLRPAMRESYKHSPRTLLSTPPQPAESRIPPSSAFCLLSGTGPGGGRAMRRVEAQKPDRAIRTHERIAGLHGGRHGESQTDRHMVEFPLCPLETNKLHRHLEAGGHSRCRPRAIPQPEPTPPRAACRSSSITVVGARLAIWPKPPARDVFRETLASLGGIIRRSYGRCRCAQAQPAIDEPASDERPDSRAPSADWIHDRRTHDQHPVHRRFTCRRGEIHPAGGSLPRR